MLLEAERTRLDARGTADDLAISSTALMAVTSCVTTGSSKRGSTPHRAATTEAAHGEPKTRCA